MLVYVVLLSLCVSLLGLAGTAMWRVERRMAAGDRDLREAQILSRAAVEWGLREVQTHSDWRTRYVHGGLSPSTAVGNGQISWMLRDTVDSDLADDPADDVQVCGIGQMRDATWVSGMVLEATVISPLNHPLHAQGPLAISQGAELEAIGAAVSTNGNLALDGNITGNAECVTTTGAGQVEGTLTEEAPAKPMPGSSPFLAYRAKATTLSYGGAMAGIVLGPDANTYGGSQNADGVYYINTSGSMLVIRGTRIYGTLVVDGDVTCDSQVLLHPLRSDYPALIVNGDLTLALDSATSNLSEPAWGANFNPQGAEYQGASDGDTGDLYPNEVQGLVHVLGNLIIQRTTKVQGVIICEGEATVEGASQLVHLPSLRLAPPLNYDIKTIVLTRQIGSWRRLAAP